MSTLKIRKTAIYLPDVLSKGKLETCKVKSRKASILFRKGIASFSIGAFSIVGGVNIMSSAFLTDDPLLSVVSLLSVVPMVASIGAGLHYMYESGEVKEEWQREELCKVEPFAEWDEIFQPFYTKATANILMATKGEDL